MRGKWRYSGDDVPVHGGAVAVHVRELDQLFHSMDPAPFHEKGLHPDAEEYIVAAARELPSGAPAALMVYLDRPAGLPDEGHVLGLAVRRHFERESQLVGWELRRLLRRGTMSLVIGLAVLAAALIGSNYTMRALGNGPIGTVIGTGLTIGGWVAMSHPLQIFLYDWWPVLGRRMLYDRLAKMPVRIVYTADPSTPAPSANGNDFAPRFGEL